MTSFEVEQKRCALPFLPRSGHNPPYHPTPHHHPYPTLKKLSKVCFWLFYFQRFVGQDSESSKVMFLLGFTNACFHILNIFKFKHLQTSNIFILPTFSYFKHFQTLFSNFKHFVCFKYFHISTFYISNIFIFPTFSFFLNILIFPV